MRDPEFDEAEDKRIEASRALSADQVFEVVRREGEEELARSPVSLGWSGLAAGLAIGFSVIAEAALLSRLPQDAPWSALISDLGYTVGFVIVVLGRLQLFTENTITPVMPICHAPTRSNFAALAKIWTVVLAANMVGTVLFGLFIMESGAFSPEIKQAVLSISRHAAHGGFLETLAKGVGAGFLIAALVWLLANTRGSTLIAVFFITYVIAIGEFAHVVAGAVEMTTLVLAAKLTISEAVFGFLVPALIGNILGGTVLFTLIAYGQIQRDIEPE